MKWKQLLTSITRSVDEELCLRNVYLVTENRVLRKQIQGRVQLTARERKVLAQLGQKLGKKALRSRRLPARHHPDVAPHVCGRAV